SPPVVNPPRGAAARGVHWVKPVLVAEIAFTEWTHDGTLRHPSFLGLREDKKAADVTREREAATPGARAGGHVPARKPKAAKARAAAKGDKSTQSNPGARKRMKRVAAKATTPSRAKIATKPATSRAPRAAKTRSAPAQTEGPVEGVTISNPGKLYYPDAGITKHDVARHYALAAPRMLPHLTGRPLSLLRCPEGWQGECFYQKHAPASLSDAVGRVAVQESGGAATYAEVHSAEGLVSLAQWGALEIHPWGSRKPRLANPDRLIFDFDPDDGVTYATLVEGVKAMRTFLAELGLPAFAKTTGGKGLHVVVPIRATVDWDVAKGFTRAVAELMAKTFPERFVASMSKARRTGRIFIDYLRNAEGATAIAPYALRARAGAPVAMPIAWAELDDGIDLRRDHFNLRNAATRLAASHPDPWRDFAASPPALTQAMRRRAGAT
ncbi:MAG TPA: DNA ligase D, partial [Casimicrobiaceae bacterium]